MRFMILLATIVTGNAMQLTFTDLKASGVQMLAASDPNAKHYLSAMGIQNDPNVIQFAPASVLLVNKDPNRGVCAYTVLVSITDANGKTTQHKISKDWPADFNFTRKNKSEPHNPGVKAGDAEYFNALFQVSATNPPPSYSLPSQIADVLLQAKAINITLDSIVFDDGKVIGPDSQGHQANLQARLDAHRDLQVIIRRWSGFQRFTPATIVSRLANLGPVPDPPLNGTPTQWYAYERLRFANELVNVGKNAGPQEAVNYAFNAAYVSRAKLSR